jgi:predicted ABC-type ATPase
MPAPQLYVFAGPNGAGKSTLASSMLPPKTPYFDGDRLFADLKKKFYDLDDGQVMRSINEVHFPDWKEEMIQLKANAAFETNFRDADVINSVEQFIDKGYEPRLIFMGLSSIEESIDRVKLRVAKGGHQVSVEYININFAESLKNLYLFHNKFCSVHIYQSFQKLNDGYEMVPLMTISQNHILQKASQLPPWVQKFSESITVTTIDAINNNCSRQ